MTSTPESPTTVQPENNYQLPPLDFLQHADATAQAPASNAERLANARLIKDTLEEFGIKVSLGEVTAGPAITRYELQPAAGVRLESIMELSLNIAAALKTDRIQFTTPIPGRCPIGIDVPNQTRTKALLGSLLASDAWRKSSASLPIILGQDICGHPAIADLAEMPHLLIAGRTGSGKSVWLDAMLASLLFRFTPDQLRFVMVDTRLIELQQFNDLPHLVMRIATNTESAISALRWVINEIESRYRLFASANVRNLKAFNERPFNAPRQADAPVHEPGRLLSPSLSSIPNGGEGGRRPGEEALSVPLSQCALDLKLEASNIPRRLPRIIVLINELAGLMQDAPQAVEPALARITQTAQAAGIHCIIATQHPSVDIITHNITAHIPARIAFQVGSRVDSRSILNALGAQALLGQGDMLYLAPGSARPHRMQGAWITDGETKSIVDFIKAQACSSNHV